MPTSGVQAAPLSFWQAMRALMPITPAHQSSAPVHADFHHTEIVSVPCPDSMSDKGGLELFQTQQRHAQTCPVVAETVRAPHPSGVGLHSRPGVV